MSRPSADRREEQAAGLAALAARESACADPVDPVNHPPHYTFGKYEVLDVLMDWFPAEPLLWQVCKYIARASHKGAMLQDLKKARFYLERRIAAIEKGTP